MLKDKIDLRQSGILLYGLTPPKQEYPFEKTFEIALRQVQRIETLDVDGLILYDIQDETARTESERPFPFLPTIDPQVYSDQFLRSLKIPRIIYKCVGKYSVDQFTQWLQMPSAAERYAVFVGAASKEQKINISVKQAYDLHRWSNQSLILGGVAIPERHISKDDEHTRIFNKIQQGCQFFVSQAVYNVSASKDLVSDIYYHTEENQICMVPLVFTLTPCGSLKTFQFMEWLGISVPKWLRNDLKHAKDILSKSIEICYTIADELIDFCSEKKIPVGFNIESIAIRKSEIDASVELLNRINTLLKSKCLRKE